MITTASAEHALCDSPWDGSARASAAAEQRIHRLSKRAIQRFPYAWALPAGGAHVPAGHFIDQDLPEWWGSRHARRMDNATTSTNASHPDPDPQGRLHGPRQPAAAPPPPRPSAGAQRPCQLPPSTRPAADQPRAAGQRACTTILVVRHLLDTAGITPSPRQVLVGAAAALGFPSLQACLADRA